MFTVKVYTRDFTHLLSLEGLTLLPRSYTFLDEGGPEQAQIDVTGGREDLWELVELLRCPVEILDEDGDVVWWGFLSQAEIHDGAMVDAVSLDGMYNRLALAYTETTPGVSTPGDRATTAWSQDDDSVTTYGTRENLLSRPQATPLEAANALAYELAQRKYPIPVTTVSNSLADPPFGKLTCRGWWDTLGWVYYSRAAGLEQNAHTQGNLNLGGGTETVVGTSHVIIDGSQAFGNGAATEKLTMTFSLAGDMTLTAFAVRLQKIGSPGDDVTLKLHADGSGTPGTLLATATVNLSSIPAALDWVAETLDTPYAAIASTTYHLVLARTGSLDASHYFVVSVDEGLGYSGGQFKIWNGSAWVARSPNADLTFRVLGDGLYTRMEQAFQLTGGEAWAASNVQIYANRSGDPADNLLAKLYDDASGSPGTLLATATLAGTSVPPSPAWLTLTFDSEVALALSTPYHLLVERSGSPDASHYYVVGVDEDQNYAGYAMHVWNGAAWVLRDPNADLAFILGGVEETTTQIETALAEAEFITGVEIEDASGLTTSPYRDGDQRLLEVVRELLKAGLTGGYRLLATVTKDRIVRLYQEPDKAAYLYLINRRGEISTTTDGPVALQTCPVGVWMRRTDVPGEANTERLVDLSRFYVQAASFDVKNGYVPTPRGAQRPYELPGLSLKTELR